MRKIAIAACVAALLGAFALAGCSDKPLVFGEEGEGVQTFEAVNSTGKDISNIAIKNSASSEYGVGIMGADDTWAADKSATLNIKLPSADPADAEDAIDADELVLPEDDPARKVLLRESWDVLVTFADGTSSEVHYLLADDIQSAEILADGDQVHIKYVSKATGEEVDSLATEQEYADAVKAEEDAKAKAEAEAKAKAEEEAKAKAEAEAQAQAEAEAAAAAQAQAEAEAAAANSYDYSYDNSSSGGSSGGGSVDQSADQCVEGGVELR